MQKKLITQNSWCLITLIIVQMAAVWNASRQLNHVKILDQSVRYDITK